MANQPARMILKNLPASTTMIMLSSELERRGLHDGISNIQFYRKGRVRDDLPCLVFVTYENIDQVRRAVVALNGQHILESKYAVEANIAEPRRNNAYPAHNTHPGPTPGLTSKAASAAPPWQASRAPLPPPPFPPSPPPGSPISPQAEQPVEASISEQIVQALAANIAASVREGGTDDDPCGEPGPNQLAPAQPKSEAAKARGDPEPEPECEVAMSDPYEIEDGGDGGYLEDLLSVMSLAFNEDDVDPAGYEQEEGEEEKGGAEDVEVPSDVEKTSSDEQKGKEKKKKEKEKARSRRPKSSRRRRRSDSYSSASRRRRRSRSKRRRRSRHRRRRS